MRTALIFILPIFFLSPADVTAFAENSLLLGAGTLGANAPTSFINLEILSLIFLIGCLLVAGVLALALYWFRPHDLSTALFALFCFSYAGWIISGEPLLINSLWPGASAAATAKLEIISLSLLVVFYAYFMKIITEEFLHPWVFHLLAAISAGVILTTLSTPHDFFQNLLGYYYLALAGIFLLILLLVIDQFHFRHKLAWVNMIGAVGLMMVLLDKILVAWEISGENLMVYFLGSVFFIFSQGMATTVRFGRIYRNSALAAVAAARTRDEFLNAMSHELKTPMNAIIGLTSVLEKTDVDEEQREKLRSIRHNSSSLLSLIEDVLSISELSSGKAKVRHQALNLEDCVESALNLSKQHWQRDKVKFRLKIDQDVPSVLIGDNTRMKQVLMHLLGYVFRNTRNGEIFLEVKQQKNVNELTHRICFELRSSNLGSKEPLHVFRYFKRESAPQGSLAKHHEPGLGVVDELVKLMGGQLKVSAKKSGTTQIRLLLDLGIQTKKSETKLRSIFERKEVDTSLKILCADDNPVNLNLLKMMLANMGLKTDLANNGKEALNMAMSTYYNIIFMDIQMPVMDGMEATQRIIENSPSRPIIVAVTANLAEVDKQKCFEAGMNDFISKPVQQEELKLAVIKWQGLKNYLDEFDDPAQQPIDPKDTGERPVLN